MISDSFLKSLSENEICFLIYILNENSKSEIYSYNALKSIKVPVLRKSLVRYRKFVKEEHVQEYDTLCRKLGPS